MTPRSFATAIIACCMLSAVSHGQDQPAPATQPDTIETVRGWPEPARITLALKQATVQEVVAALSRQTISPVTLVGMDPPTAGRRIDVNFDHTSYWTAILEICRKSGLKINEHTAAHTTLAPRPSDEELCDDLAYSSENALMIPQEVRRDTMMNLGSSRQFTALTLSWVTYFELKVGTASVDVATTIDEVIDDQGRSLVARNKKSWTSETQLQNGQRTLFSNVIIDHQQETGHVLVTVRGRHRFRIPTKLMELHCDLSDAKSEHDMGQGLWLRASNVEVLDPTLGWTGCRLHLGLRGPDAAELSLTHANTVLHTTRMVDAAGHQLEFQNFLSGGSERNSGNVIALYAVTGGQPQWKVEKPLSLVGTVIVETQDKFLPFELRNLPLP